MPEYPEILVLDNQDQAGPCAPSIESRWHTDVTFVPNPPMASILHGVIVPPYGGDTQWTTSSWPTSGSQTQIRDLIDGLHAVHHNVAAARAG